MARRARKKNFKQGRYTPRHPEKYIGDVDNIVYRSSWELEANIFFDNNENVLEWNSEGIIIPYVKPTTGRVHKYYMDYFVRYMSRTGEVITELIEVKPRSQMSPSKSRNRKTKLYEDLTYAINVAKWKAAAQFAKAQGWKFTIMNETKLFK